MAAGKIAYSKTSEYGNRIQSIVTLGNEFQRQLANFIAYYPEFVDGTLTDPSHFTAAATAHGCTNQAALDIWELLFSTKQVVDSAISTAYAKLT